jgi:hypothetical protein
MPLKGRTPRSLNSAGHDADFKPRAALTAGAYLLKARKRVSTLTLIRPRKRVRTRVLVGAAETTHKVGP